MNTDQSSNRKIRVAIVGGGIGGLCLAISLLEQPHIDVQVYEGAHQFSEIGAGLSLGVNARRALHLLGPDIFRGCERQLTGNGPDYPHLQNVYVRAVKGTGSDAGHVIVEILREDGQQSVHRAKFLDELIQLVPAEISHFNKRLTKLENSDDDPVTLHFGDGTTVIADCVVGADGVHSIVRKHFVSEDHPAYHPTYSGAAAYRGLIPMEQAQAALGHEASQIVTVYTGPGALIMTYPVDFHKLLNIVAVDATTYTTWDGPSVQKADLDKMRTKFANWSDPVSEIMTMLDVPDTKTWSLWELSPLPTFHQPRIVLTGDAAHATTPFQGAGAGQAIEDALVLSRLLARTTKLEDLDPAFAAYDQIRRPRSQKVVSTSHDLKDLYCSTTTVSGDKEEEERVERRHEERMKRDLPHWFDWIFDLDVQDHVDRSLAVLEDLKSDRNKCLPGKVGRSIRG